MSSKLKDKVVVAMSGGVDSSTVAAILHDQNYQVIGITLQLYDNAQKNKKNNTCCAGKDIYDARIVADKIGIPHYVLNYETLFKKKVIENFAESYMKGETPIPCITCNQKIKFQDLLKVSKNLGAKFLATGHYVRKISVNNKNLLLKGIDETKDQSYFLFNTTIKQLDFLEFPLGNFTKNETREIAKKYELTNVYNKYDSQDICFVQGGNYSSVIKKLNPKSHIAGEITNTKGEVLGKHDGIVNFTIGQRRGIKISDNKPLYVIKIDPKNNRIIVGEKNDLKVNTLKVRQLNWLSDDYCLNNKIDCCVKINSSHKEIKAIVKYLGDGFAEVRLQSYCYAATPGQACVMYHGERVLGGGWIM